ncbi:MAG: septum site-determining protein MinC [Caulobacteraceae bacterium]|nr:septum site-determining protein MinC [Caulobacteraceae bacterium]
MLSEAISLPNIQVRGRSFVALIVAPEAPLEFWFEALDAHMARSAGFFAGQPVVAELSALTLGDVGETAVLEALDGLVARGLRVIGVEGIDEALIAGTRWQGLPVIKRGRDVAPESSFAQAPSKAATPAAPARSAPPSLLIDQPVRSGQSVIFKEGDVVIVGSVASGAEVIAGGSIHVYGPLRGRAIAGVKRGAPARIFCRKLEAELVAVEGVYKTADHWGAEVHGRPAQVHRDGDGLIVSAFD